MESNTYLSKLPVDLLRNIIECMPVEDVLSLKKWAENERDDFGAVVQECDHRMSVRSYLDKTIGNGSKWLDAMSKCMCYISGSRSLEFFVPGCTTSSSDLDLYTYNGAQAGRFMRLTSCLGVRWFSTLDLVAKQIQQGDVDMLFDGCSVVEILRSGKLQNLCEENSYSFECERRVWYEEFLTIKVKEKKVSVLCSGSPGHPTGYEAGNIRRIKRGELLCNGATMNVQLMHENRRSGELSVDALFDFHSSCVQSFIGPYMACHLYGKLAARKRSYYWQDNVSAHDTPMIVLDDEQIQPSRDMGHWAPEWEKYERRGFKYTDPTSLTGSRSIPRRIGDNQCTTIQYSDHTEAPESVVNMYKRHMDLIQWCYLGGQYASQYNTTKHTRISESMMDIHWFKDVLPREFHGSVLLF